MASSPINCYKTLISASECCEIVSKALGDVHILKYEVQPLTNDVVGFLGEYFKLEVSFSQREQKIKDTQMMSFFVKSLPLNNELQRKEIKALGFMKKEILLYKTLFNDMEKYTTFRWHPKMYLGRDDVLVLEDLYQSSFKHMSFNYNSPPEYIRLGLECMAAMHACSIVYEVKNGVNIGEKYENCIFETSLRQENSWVIAGLKAICNTARIHSKLQSKEHQDFIKNHLLVQLETIFDQQESFKRYRKTVCHRDLWEKNIFYCNLNQQLRSIFVDFQLVSYCPPGVDVIFFIHLNTSRSNRKEHLDSYQKYYYSCLKKFAIEYDVKIDEYLSWEEFEASVDQFKIISLALTAVYAPVVFLPEGYLETLKKKSPEEYHRLMHVERDNFVLECIRKFKNVGDVALEAVEVLVEYCFERFMKPNLL